MKLDPIEFLDGLMNLPTGYSAQRSPDGKHNPLNILNLHQNLDIFLTNTKSTQHLTAMTNTSEYTLLYKWWEDSKSILVGEDKDGDERVTLYRVFLDNPEILHSLTKLKPNYYLRSPSVSPDGQNLYYFANYDFSKDTETEIFHLFHHNLLDGDITLLTSPEKPALHTALLNLAGTKILYNRCDITPGGYQ